MALNFGVSLPSAGPMATAENLRTVAQTAERLGFDSVWVSDHVIAPETPDSVYPYGGGGPFATPGSGTYFEPLTTMNGVAELLLKASPLCLIALGLAIGFRANVWNIGAEGQMYLGGIFATGLAIQFNESGGAWLIPAMIAAGALGGALWASIAAFLRARLHTNEILVSLMLTYVADLLVKYLVYGPWRDPQANNFPITVTFSDDATFALLAGWADWLEGTRINTSVFLTLAAIPLAWLFMERSFLGFQLTEIGRAHV